MEFCYRNSKVYRLDNFWAGDYLGKALTVNTYDENCSFLQGLLGAG